MLSSLLKAAGVTAPLAEDAVSKIAPELSTASGRGVYPRSIVASGGVVYFLGRRGLDKRLCLLWDEAATPTAVGDYCGERSYVQMGGMRLALQAGYLDHQNAAALRRHLPFTAPQVQNTRRVRRGRPARPGDSRSRPRGARHGPRPFFAAAVHQRDDPHRPHAGRGDGHGHLRGVRGRLARWVWRRCGSSEDGAGYRRHCCRRVHDVHHRPGRSR